MFGRDFEFAIFSLYSASIISESDLSELYVVGDQLKSRKKVPDKRINSRVILFTLKEPDSMDLKKTFKEPAKITFTHKKVSGITIK